MQTFLTIVNHLNVSIQHVSGASNIVADFASRNASPCQERNCQICKFNEEVEDAVVFKIGSVETGGTLPIPFGNRAAWREIQSRCPSMVQASSHLRGGTRPSKKCTKVNDTKRYLRVATLARDGLLIVNSQGAFTEATERIVVPRAMVEAVLTAIHQKGNHPTPHQLKAAFNRNFAALDIDRAITENTDSCHTCASVRRFPKHITTFSTSEPPSHVGQLFSVDVLRRAGQAILVSRESVSSFTSAAFIKSERAMDLQEGLISLIFPLHPSEGPETTIRTDPAPGFQSLVAIQPLKDKGILIELGRFKNPNKNPVADKAIQELEDELIRIDPTGAAIDCAQLTTAVSNLNSRIRLHGLSAYELMFRRNQFTASQLDNEDKAVIAAQHQARVTNQPSSHNSQLPKSTKRLSRFNSASTPDVGTIIYLKNDRSKHKAREQYMVTSTDGDWLVAQKMIKGRLRSRGYKIHRSECFTLIPIKQNQSPASHALDDSDDDASWPPDDHGQGADHHAAVSVESDSSISDIEDGPNPIDPETPCCTSQQASNPIGEATPPQAHPLKHSRS